MKDFAYLATVLLWIAGIVIVKGFWLTVLTIVFPPYSLYLVVEKVMIMNGWL